jgi:hypothetical protein
LLPLVGTGAPHQRHVDLAALEGVGHRLVRGKDFHARFFQLQQRRVAGLEILIAAAMGEGGGDDRLIEENVGKANLTVIFRLPEILVGGRRRDGFLVVDDDQPAIDMRDGIAGLELREDGVEQGNVGGA